MMRSLYSGVSGLRSQQIKMDVLGNNIANVGTAGFKKSRVVFSDKLYQATRGASGATDERGGTNPMSVGLGTAVFSIDQIHTPYTAQVTNRLTDMAINGDGYFIVKQSDGAQVYTRSGAFIIDELNNLVTVNGDFVQGWLADEDGNFNTSPSRMTNINLSAYQIMAPRATTEMRLEGNLNSSMEVITGTGAGGAFVAASDVPDDEQCDIISKEFYDSLGNKNTLYFRFFKTDANEWAVDLSLDPSFSTAQGTTGSLKPATGAAVAFSDIDDPDTYRITGITFASDGKLNQGVLDMINITVGTATGGTAAGSEEIKFDIDLSDIRQYNSTFSVDVAYQNGNETGTLVSRSVGTDGIMRGTYSNGEIRAMFQVALASFKNPEGLEQVGDSSWRESANSGSPQIGEPGSGARGAVIPGSLEMSNVDLAEEFTELIVTQRGFSANSRVITTSDEMLQELVNLKR